MHTYFRLKQKMVELGKAKMAVVAGQKTKEEMLVEMRRALLFGMRGGQCVGYHLDMQSIDMWDEYTDEAIFPADKIFDFALW